MMKIGVISDTHGLLREEILEILRSCDCILHFGHKVNAREFPHGVAVIDGILCCRVR